MKIQNHPLRDFAWKELHARPYVRFTAAAHVFHVSFLSVEQNEENDAEQRQLLAEALNLATNYETPRHRISSVFVAGLGRLVVSWELHTEYVSYTLFLYELAIPFVPFGFDFSDLLPKEWLRGFGKGPIVATRMAIGRREQMPSSLVGMRELFEGHTLNGSEVMAGKASVWSCYREHEDGANRIAVLADEMSTHDLGRTVARLLEIEDFWHLTLAPLPLAAKVKRELADAERRMVTETDLLRETDRPEQKRAILDAVLGVAADVEHLRARVSGELGRSLARFVLLESIFSELRESKIEHVLRLSGFVMRRIKPAADTYRGILTRLANLSERVGRASDLLRTSIELHLEEQNQKLLESTERRVRLQLQLQGAVEGLSIVVISYYVLTLFRQELEAIDSAGGQLNVELILGLAMPVTLVVVWRVLHSIRKRIRTNS
ncbi:MAG: DUF3422 family protein [Thermoanaerobaculia bacterium]